MKNPTLKNINDFTKQEIFEYICNHLLSQKTKCYNNKSKSGNGCLYRSGNLKCAVGCLIPDEEYVPQMEAKDAFYLCRSFYNNVTEDMIDFLLMLQKIHDKLEPQYWKDNLIALGEELNLKTDFLEN